MKTLQEILETVGLTEEQQTKLKAELTGKGSGGKDLELLIANNGEYVKAEKFETLNKEKQTLEMEFKTKQNEFSKLEELTGKNAELAEQFNAFKAESAKERVSLSKRFEVEKKFIADGLPTINGSYDAYHTGINYDSIVQLQSGKFDGITEQYNLFKTTNKDLFTKATITHIPPGDGGNPPPVDKGYTKDTFGKLSMSEQMKFANENPEDFSKLIGLKK